MYGHKHRRMLLCATSDSCVHVHGRAGTSRKGKGGREGNANDIKAFRLKRRFRNQDKRVCEATGFKLRAAQSRGIFSMWHWGSHSVFRVGYCVCGAAAYKIRDFVNLGKLNSQCRLDIVISRSQGITLRLSEVAQRGGVLRLSSIAHAYTSAKSHGTARLVQSP
jgi:hypothetical protein